MRPDGALFGEAQGRVIISVDPRKEEDFIRFCEEKNLSPRRIGRTDGDRIRIGDSIDVSLEYAFRIWKHSFEEKLSL